MTVPHGNGDVSELSLIAERTIPDFYSDSVQFEINVYGVTLEFGQVQKLPRSFQGKVPPRPVVKVHMSPQHAKVMAKLFVKNMQAYEEQVGKIPIPQALLDELGIGDE